jgi:hypothetical protein
MVCGSNIPDKPYPPDVDLILINYISSKEIPDEHRRFLYDIFARLYS